MRPRPRLQHRHIRTDRVVSWWIGERLGHHRRGPHIIGDQMRPAQPFLTRRADAHAGREREPIRPRLPSQLARPGAIGVEHRLGQAAGQQRAHHVSALGGKLAGIDAHPGHPYRRRRLLDRPRPDVDVSVVEVLALPVEWPVGGGQRLQDEIMRLPVAPHQPRGVRVGRRDLVRRALHQPHLQPPARQHVQPGHLLGHPHRIGSVGDRIAQGQQPRAFGFTCNHRQCHRHRNGHAGRRAVVLVHHDVEPDLVAISELVEVAVQQPVCLERIEIAVGQHHPQRAALEALRPGGVIGHLGKIPDSHC